MGLSLKNPNRVRLITPSNTLIHPIAVYMFIESIPLIKGKPSSPKGVTRDCIPAKSKLFLIRKIKNHNPTSII